MSVSSSELNHAMKTNNMHSTPDELQVFFVERTRSVACEHRDELLDVSIPWWFEQGVP